MGLRRGGWVGVALVVALLAGCSGDAEKKPSGLVTPSASPTLKATTSDVPTVPPWPVRPQYPDAARRRDAAGAQAAFEYFLVGITYGFRTGNPSVLQEVTGPLCEYCDSVKKLVLSLEADGRLFAGGDPASAGYRDVTKKSKDSVSFTVAVVQTASILMTRDGKVLARNTPSPSKMQVLMFWARDHWIVFNIKIVG